MSYEVTIEHDICAASEEAWLAELELALSLIPHNRCEIVFEILSEERAATLRDIEIRNQDRREADETERIDV